MATTKKLNEIKNTSYGDLNRGQKQALKTLTPTVKDFEGLPAKTQAGYIHGNLVRLHKKIDRLLELLEKSNPD